MREVVRTKSGSLKIRSLELKIRLLKSEAERGFTLRQTKHTEINYMFSWALLFFIVAIIAGVLGLSGIAGTMSSIAYLLFVIGLILAIVFAITGRKPKL